MVKLHLVGVDTRIEIEVICRSHPDYTDYWDGNWITSKISIDIPGYKAQFNAELRTDELSDFANELTLMDRKLKGKASLFNLDGYLELECKINKQGVIFWTVETCYPAGIGAVLKFDFCSDQSYLKGIVSEIESILTVFPVLGNPNS